MLELGVYELEEVRVSELPWRCRENEAKSPKQKHKVHRYCMGDL